uniref:dUTPase-like domain-containing protein n=1 Tax=Pseudonaja textilis TaxID=8673 RepID=A0A670YIH5_PSETE
MTPARSPDCQPMSVSVRKLANGCGTHPESKVCLSHHSDSSSSLSHSSPATAGSAGIDLITQEEIEFKFPMEVKIVPSQFKGPLPSGLVGLILPHSSAHKKGYFVVPGVTDSDYTGIVMIQIWVNLPQVLPSSICGQDNILNNRTLLSYSSHYTLTHGMSLF